MRPFNIIDTDVEFSFVLVVFTKGSIQQTFNLSVRDTLIWVEIKSTSFILSQGFGDSSKFEHRNILNS